MQIGFIGLGQMGRGIARSLLSAGHDLTVWNRSPEPAKALAQEGARLAKEPGDAMQGDALFSILASDRAMQEVGLDSALLDTAAAGLVHVNLATISPAFARALAAAHERRGLGYVAAPVFGRPEAAAKAELVVIAAAADQDFAKVEEPLGQIGRRTVKVGKVAEQANLFKLAGNFMIISVLETLGEAFALLKKGGVDPAQFLGTMTEGLFAAPIYRNYGKLILDGKFEPPGFFLRLGLKDASLVRQAAEELEVAMPVAELAVAHFEEAMKKGWGERDWAALTQLIAQKAKL